MSESGGPGCLLSARLASGGPGGLALAQFRQQQHCAFMAVSVGRTGRGGIGSQLSPRSVRAVLLFGWVVISDGIICNAFRCLKVQPSLLCLLLSQSLVIR